MKDEIILVQDFDLAKLYQVETKALKQAVRRNLDRFPDDFMFTLSNEEYNSLIINIRSQFVTLDIKANIAIMRAFVRVREYLLAASSVSSELNELKAKVDLLAMKQDENQEDIKTLYEAIGEIASRLDEKRNEPRPRIGFK